MFDHVRIQLENYLIDIIILPVYPTTQEQVNVFNPFKQAPPF